MVGESFVFWEGVLDIWSDEDVEEEFEWGEEFNRELLDFVNFLSWVRVRNCF